MDNALEKYVNLALDLEMINATNITPADICFDIRAILKCCWGCDRSFSVTPRCDNRDTTFEQRMEMIKRYNNVLLVHSHDATKLSQALLRIERTAFLDGYYFAFTIRSCNLCKECLIQKGEECPFPDKVRPCDQMFGIDVYKTVRQLGFPCEVLQSEDSVQNRYGFLLID